MSNYLKLSALALGLVCAGQAAADSLTAVSFGGANKQAQTKAF
ncbi:Spermidine/putrescine ABC transporter substrate-binding protein OS=Stutzerimonas stutzeri OX=316 GN=CXK95_13600 PE=4 SV=1 [Stutzerimonas stutzeri]